MKNHCLLILVVLSLLLPARLVAQAAPSLVGTYTWTFSDREGRPSECDCDYRLAQITLHADSTCLYLTQQGRLSPRLQQWERGTWALVSGDLVELHITEVKGGYLKLADQQVDLEKWRALEDRHHFKRVGRHLENEGNIYD
jgi:hypothetical protein